MTDISMSDAELLKYAVEHGMIDTALVQEKVEMQKRKEILEKHPYKVYQGNDGKWYTYFPDDEKGRVKKKRNTKDDIEDLIFDYWKEKLENPTVEEVFTEWIDNKIQLKEISKSTYNRYKIDFERFFSDFKNKKIKEVTEIEIEDFMIHSISKFSLTSKAFGNLRTLVFGIFKRAKKKKYIDFSITQVVNDMEVSKNLFKKTIKEDGDEVFMDDETPKVLRYLEDHADIVNIGILLMFVTGMRVGELATIKFSDINGNTINIRRTETRFEDEDGNYIYEVKEFPKTEAGVRTIIIPRNYVWVIERAKELNPSGDYVMMKNGERIKTYSFRKRLYLVCNKTHVKKKSPHKIRKTYGSILIDNGVDRAFVIQQMGHTDIECTEKHYHRNRRDINAKARIIDKIPEFAEH